MVANFYFVIKPNKQTKPTFPNAMSTVNSLVQELDSAESTIYNSSHYTLSGS